MIALKLLKECNCGIKEIFGAPVENGSAFSIPNLGRKLHI